MTTELEGAALNRAIAERLGWTYIPGNSTNDFATDLNACASAEQVLRDKGCLLMVNVYETGPSAPTARWVEAGLRGWVGNVYSGGTECEARARALLTAPDAPLEVRGGGQAQTS